MKRLGMDGIGESEVRAWVRGALAEDVGWGDVTTLACVGVEEEGSARIAAREPLVVAGLALAEAAFCEMSPNVRLEREVNDGDGVEAGAVVAWVRGQARALLTAERVALNYLQRLSGIATMTRRFVERVEGTGATILDTRKTTPGWRKLEKYAVRCGGGSNHRMGLYDRMMLKDNHWAAVFRQAGVGEIGSGASGSALRSAEHVRGAIERMRRLFPGVEIEVEVDRLEEVEWVAAAGVDYLLLDNFSLEDLREAVRRVGGRVKTEASGGVRLETVRGIADTGVNFISVGALTHSVRAVDLGLDFEL